MKKYLAIIGVALLARIAILTFYGPVYANDTPGYESLMTMLKTGNYANYDAWRTPGYPVFMVVLNNNHNAILACQAAGGILLTLLIFRILTTNSGVVSASFLYGMFVATAINIIVIEANILTESLAALLFTIAIYATYIDERRPERFRLLNPIFIGLLIAGLTLTRPQFIVMIPISALWLISCNQDDILKRTLRLSCFLLASCIPVISLLYFNFMLLGKPLLSTTIGSNITNHTLPFIDRGTKADTQNIIPEMIRLRNKHWEYAQSLDDNRAFIPRPQLDGNRVDSSKYYLSLSLEAIREAPMQYASSVFKAWLRFWRVSLLYDSDNIRSRMVDIIVTDLWIFQKIVWLALNTVFLASAILAILSVYKCRTFGWYECSIALVLGVSVLQAAVEYGDNSRYAIPVQPIVGMIAVYSLWNKDQKRITIGSTLRRTKCAEGEP